MKIDITKPVRTRDGNPVTLISDKGRKSMVRDGPVYNLLGFIGEGTRLYSWTAEGRFAITASSGFDLAQELEVWLNVYPTSSAAAFTGPDAYHRACQTHCNPIARVRVPYTPGQFDTPQA